MQAAGGRGQEERGVSVVRGLTRRPRAFVAVHNLLKAIEQSVYVVLIISRAGHLGPVH